MTSGKQLAKSFVLLDRDGTVIFDKVYQKDPALTELLPNAAEGLRRLTQAGYGLAIVTNQSGIRRGYISEAELISVNQSVIDVLAKEGVRVDGVYYCPHRPEDNCGCRKPLPGMVENAVRDLGFDPRASVMVGDREADVGLGKAVGARTVLLRTGGGMEAEKVAGGQADYVADDLLDAADWIIDNVPVVRAH